ncbi:hypothetical protein [Sandaracinus amylolyticus]|uniref:hypothetical protein n=1 Tax=Sandaracinus amylolyticus TaxID=927083 RepID=UPI001F2200FF|nr:hypothetical protein [Sandaracinus amylolyticus]UJR82325.1 Hypothetical protein I5071_43900 [Sandaracinus amylolyticus]
MEIRLALERVDLDAELAAARAQELSFGAPQSLEPSPDAVTEARFVETVAVIGVVSLAWIAKRCVDTWLKDKERGVMIDLRTTPPTISRVEGVPAGFLVMVDASGKATTKKIAYDQPEQMLPMLEAALAAGKPGV